MKLVSLFGNDEQLQEPSDGLAVPGDWRKELRQHQKGLEAKKKVSAGVSSHV